MIAIGYARVSTDRQADKGVSLDAQKARIEAMAVLQERTLLEVIVDGGESAKNLNRPGLQRLLALVQSGKVQAVIVAKLDRLTRSVKDLCGLLDLFEKRKVALISVAESLDTSSAARRLVITIMGAVTREKRSSIAKALELDLAFIRQAEMNHEIWERRQWAPFGVVHLVEHFNRLTFVGSSDDGAITVGPAAEL